MPLVTELDLPLIDYDAPDFVADSYHARLAAAHESGWLARTPIAYIVLEHESGEFFLRSRNAAFPGQQLADFFGITAGPLREHIDANILNQSGEQHRRLRALVGSAFTPRAAARWRPAMRDFLRQLWDDIAPAGRCEFVSAVAKPYPSLTIAAVLGAPARDAPRLHEWSNWVQRQFDIRALESQAGQIEQAVIELTEYVSALLAERRARLSDDLISTLLAAEADGDRLSPTECVNLVANVLQGGVDTTQSQLAQALRLFAAHPEQWQLLGSDPGLAPRAVQEVLRFEPITPFTARICLADIEHRGVTFPAGTIVAICTERANREQRDGETFDITAERDGRLLTFGAGVHFCLGANLATAELEEALAFLAPRMPSLAADGEVTLGGVEGIYGVERLPLRWAGAVNPDIPN
ncbi:MAG TPA: cytochrome P450 [Streptosporangiaceae bacterium]|nr:cytochrome P450 [Streptosporangiaceae bacterium]